MRSNILTPEQRIDLANQLNISHDRPDLCPPSRTEIGVVKEKSMTIREKIAHVNATLAEGEPANISVDNKGYAGYSPQAVIDAMNTTFDVGQWGFDEITPPLKAIEGE